MAAYFKVYFVSIPSQATFARAAWWALPKPPRKMIFFLFYFHTTKNPERIKSSQYHVTQSAAFFCSASSFRRKELPLLNAVKILNHHLSTSAYLCHISKGKKGIALKALDRRRQESNGIKSWTINIPVSSDMRINIGLLIFTRSLSNFPMFSL